MEKTFNEGDFIRHEEMGVGKVLLADNGELMVEFGDGRECVFKKENGSGFPVTPLNSDGFLVRLQLNKHSLKEQSETDPEGLVVALLKDHGGKLSLKDLKAALTGGVVPSSAWTKWWKGTEAALKENPFIRLDGARDKSVHFREDISSDLIERFEGATSLNAKRTVALEAVRLREKGVDVEEALEAMAVFFWGVASSDHNPLPPRIHAWRLIDRLTPADDDSGIGLLDNAVRLATQAVLRDSVEGINDREDLKAYADRVAALRIHSYPRFILDLLQKSTTQQDFAIKTIAELDAAEGFQSATAEIRQDLRINPLPFIGVVRGFMKSPKIWARLGVTARELFEGVFFLYNDLRKATLGGAEDVPRPIAKEEKELTSVLRDSRLLDSLLNELTVDETAALFYEYNRSGLLEVVDEDEDREIVRALAVFQKRDPSLQVGEIKKKLKKKEPETMLMTRERFEALKKELDELDEAKIPAIVQNIASARQEGDLSENFEYHEARRQHGFLMGRKKELEKLLEVAELID